MIFKTPLGLLGLLSIPVIILLHMFRQRQKKETVSSLFLWAFLTPQVRGPQPRQIPLTWILVLDILAATLFSLAMAQPSLPKTTHKSPASHVIALLDVSLSMAAEDAAPDRLSAAKTGVQALLDALNKQDTFSLISFDAEARWLADLRRESPLEISSKLASLQPAQPGAALRDALALAQSIAENGLPLVIHIFTDGAWQQASLEILPDNTTLIWHFIGQPVDNQAIQNISIKTLDDGSVQVFARVVNYGKQDVARTLLALADGQVQQQNLLNLPAGSSLVQLFNLPGMHSLYQLKLEGVDALPLDDQAAVGYTSTEKIKVDLVAAQPFPLEQAVKASGLAEVKQTAPENYLQTTGSGMTIFRGMPQQYPAGVVLVVDPTANAELDAGMGYAVAANTQPQIASADQLFEGINFAGVRWGAVSALPATITENYESLLNIRATNGLDVPLLIRFHPQNQAGSVYLLLADLGSGNFTRHPAFPLLIHNLIKNINRVPLPAQTTSGGQLALPSAQAYRALTITNPLGEATPIALESQTQWQAPLLPGGYQFDFVDQSGAAIRHMLGVNAGSHPESDLQASAWTQLAPLTQTGLQTIEPAPLDLLPYVLGLALLIILLEAYLAWRH